MGAAENCSRDILSSYFAWGGHRPFHSLMANREVRVCTFLEILLVLHEYLLGIVLARLLYFGQHSVPIAGMLMRQGI